MYIEKWMRLCVRETRERNSPLIVVWFIFSIISHIYSSPMHVVCLSSFWQIFFIFARKKGLYSVQKIGLYSEQKKGFYSVQKKKSCI